MCVHRICSTHLVRGVVHNKTISHVPIEISGHTASFILVCPGFEIAFSEISAAAPIH